MRYLVFDQSCTASAAVVMQRTSQGFILSDFALHEPKKRGIDRLTMCQAWFKKMVDTHNPDVIVRELHNQKTFGAANQLHALGAFIDMIAYGGGYLDGCRYARVPVTTWKKYCLGRGNVAKDTGYLMKINKFIKETTLIHPASKAVVENDNIGDAICMGVTAYACREVVLGQPILGTAAQRDVLKKAAVLFDYAS